MKIVKKILLIIVVFLSALILNQTTSEAKRIDFGTNSGILSIHEQNWEVEGWDLKLGLDYTFCLQHGQHAREGATWSVQNYIRIEGRHSTFYVNNYYDDAHKLAEHDNDENLMLAWILNQAFEPSDFSDYGNSSTYYSNIQKAVYGFFPKWATANDYSIPASAGGEEYLPYENSARNYVNWWKTQQDASITNNTNKDNLTKEIISYSGAQYIKIGPFNMTYNGTFSDMQVFDQNNNAINALYAKYNGTSLQVYTNASDAVKSGQNFYILVPANQGISKINRVSANVTVNKQNLISEVWVIRLEHPNYSMDEMQTLITSESRVENTEEEISMEITDIELFGSLVINKTDADTGSALANVGFRLKMTSGAKAGQYVSVDSSGNVSYSSSPSTITTNSNGQIAINNLYQGTYELTEVSNPTFGYIEGTVVVASGITVNPGQTTTQNVTNKKQYANLLIRKTDEATGSAMQNVQFTLQKIGGTNAGQYVSVDANGNAVYSTSVKYLKTDGNGQISINYLYAGTYQLTETYNPNYGYEDTPKVITSNLTLTGGQQRTYDVTNEQIYGGLVIVKTDKDSGQALSNIGFTIQMTSGEKNGQYVYVDSSGNAVYSSTARSVTTNSSGRVEIDKMYPGTYRIVETSNPYYGYERVPITISSGTQVVVGQTTTANLTNELVYGKLKIRKTDQDTGEAMANVGFTLRMTSGEKAGEYVSVNSNGEAVYSTTPSTIITDSNGEINISYIYKGTYELIETVNPNFGYEDLPKTITSNLQVTAGDTVTTINATNRREYIKISGYAWEDREQDKTSIKDNLWNENTYDERLQYVTVRLVKADGTVLATTVTDENGEYIFGNYDEDPNAVKIRIDDLTGAYVEFEYNGMSYQTIAIRSENNGNKATDSALRNDMNNRFATIVKDASQNTNGQNTHTIRYNRADYTSTVIYGDSVNKGYEGQTYPISGVDDQYVIQAITTRQDNNILCTTDTADSIRKNGTEEITNINLGVEEREMPDLNVAAQDVENVQIMFNDYTHTYQYGQVSADTSTNGFAGGDVSNVGVRFASKYIASSYTRAIYTSDIVYNSQPGNDGSLQVYVNYAIRLVNEATTLNSTIKSIANYYDSRYTIVGVGTGMDDEGNIIGSLDYTEESYNSNGYSKATIYTEDNARLEAQTDTYVYIRYQMNNDAINDILNENATLNSITEITSYSSYTDNTFNNPYAGIDVDSAPDNATPGDTTTYEDDTNWAPSLILELKEGRMIEGTVWEDSAVDALLAGTGFDKERKGDGRYDATTENVVNNVKVELLTYDDATNTVGNVAQLYKKDNSVVNAETTTGPDDEGINGSYSFSGVIPGKYVIRYTYGDTSVICDTSGNVIKNVVADDYKSTIYRDGIQSAADAMTDYWYRGETSHEGALRLSDAKDDEQFITQRITDEEINYGTVVSGSQFTEIFADTRQFEIKLDYDVNLDNTSGYGIDLKFVFDNIDFGIIERPRQSLIVDKEVADVNIQLANGSTLISGDPRTENLSYVRLLPDGSLHIEVDNEIIQGATLTLTYEISVDNSNSEIDYNDENYYIYGTKPDGNANYTIASVVDMYDYLPDDVMLQSTDGNWETKEITSDLSGTYLAEKVYDIVKGFQNVVHLKQPNSIFANMAPNSKESTTLTVSRQLSVSSDDLTYENDVEIIELEGRRSVNIETGEYDTPGNYDPTTNQSYDPDTDTFVGDEQDDDYVEVIITGPTGENRQYIIYGIIGISMLILIGAGIVVIKKFVIKK